MRAVASLHVRRQFVVGLADMAEEHRERDEGAAGMVDPDKNGVRDDVEGLLPR
jgi:hypothetical protein